MKNGFKSCFGCFIVRNWLHMLKKENTKKEHTTDCWRNRLHCPVTVTSATIYVNEKVLLNQYSLIVHTKAKI